MEKPAGQPADKTGSQYAELFLLDFYKGRQVLSMSAYEVIMICIAAMTLVLKMIEVYHGRNHK